MNGKSLGKILLADDEPTFLSATADLLRAEGYECITVQDGDAALKAAASETFDLLITDLEMPGNSDLQLVRKIAEQSGGLPVIILTGFPSVRSAIASIDLPVVAYLTKPVAFPELLERVARAVKRFRSFQAMRQHRGAAERLARRVPAYLEDRAARMARCRWTSSSRSRCAM